MKKPLGVTVKDLLYVQDEVRKRWIDESSSKTLPGSSEFLTEGQFTTVCYLKAALGLFHRKGLFSSAVDVELFEVDVDPLD